jgi:guanine nucleotide-binding protein subunit alpha
LQKQFQLFYSSHALERERGSWRAAVSLNVIRAVRAIFDGLEYRGAASVDGSPDSDITSEAHGEIARLRNQLQPLLAAESAISSELNGGLSGRASAYVRSGWQKIITPHRSKNDSSCHSDINLYHRTLGPAVESIEALWHHPLVTELAELRKLNIEDSAPL